ncbi:MAG TPA: phosphate ABC transporter permease PstA [Propionibacterium sp.]|jgi:phosphate transport system permease protein|nr:phosphate ABC transporter permease PstA [Propionibacterium sp.]
MSTMIQDPKPVERTSEKNPLTSGQLPKWMELATAVVVIAIAAALLSITGSFNIGLLVAVAFVLFLIVMYAASAGVEGTRQAANRVAKYVVFLAFTLAIIPLISLIAQVISRGLTRFDMTYFTYSMSGVYGDMAGGAIHAIWGTLIITGIATLISVPIGLFTAIYLVEYGGKNALARGITFLVDVMTGIPSIVAGLFAFSMFVLFVGPGTKSGLAGAVALCILMIPYVVRNAEEVLRLVPRGLREASYALGVTKWRTIVKVVIPTAISGIVSGVILAIARIIGETAPLLLTAGLATNLVTNPMPNPTINQMTTLPVFVYYQYMQPGTSPDANYARAWTGALVLILIVMTLNLVGRFIAARFAPKTKK